MPKFGWFCHILVLFLSLVSNSKENCDVSITKHVPFKVSCIIMGPTTSDIILRSHNGYRWILSIPYKQQPGSPLQKIKWSSYLSDQAQVVADNCKNGSCPSLKKYLYPQFGPLVVLNLAQSTPTTESNWTHVVNAIVKNYLTTKKGYEAHKIWRTATHMGCGHSVRPSSTGLTRSSDKRYRPPPHEIFGRSAEYKPVPLLFNADIISNLYEFFAPQPKVNPEPPVTEHPVEEHKTTQIHSSSKRPRITKKKTTAVQGTTEHAMTAEQATTTEQATTVEPKTTQIHLSSRGPLVPTIKTTSVQVTTEQDTTTEEPTISEQATTAEKATTTEQTISTEQANTTTEQASVTEHAKTTEQATATYTHYYTCVYATVLDEYQE